MSPIVYLSALIALTGFCGIVVADPQNCINTDKNIAFDSKFSGVWYEQANSKNLGVACSQVDITNEDNSKWILLMSTTEKELASNVTHPFNFTISSDNKLMQVKINDSLTYNVKLLKFVEKNYTVVCSYTNAQDSKTTFGVILTADRVITNELRSYLKQNFTDDFTDLSPTMPEVFQSDKCFRSSAANLTVLSTFFVLIFAALKMLH